MTVTEAPTTKVPWLTFELDEAFFQTYRGRVAPFGGNGLGEATFYRTYSRDDNPRLPVIEGDENLPVQEQRHYMETWADTCRRVIEGMHTIEMQHCITHRINYNLDKAQRAAQEAFALMFDMKWMPPGRGVQMMGTQFIHEREMVEALQNCAFVSTADLADNPAEPFRWLMNQSMMGVGVGFDVKGAGQVVIRKPVLHSNTPWVIDDTREAWAWSVALLIESYTRLGPDYDVEFDYSLIRPAGAPIRGFGGVASGPDSLKELHETIRSILDEYDGRYIDSRLITDLQNAIGYCVVSGNVRRSAEIALGSADDEDFISLKDYTLPQNEKRAAWGFLSNNSVLVEPMGDPSYYLPMAKQTWKTGEPGFIWMDNVHSYARMNKILDRSDGLAAGFNPCAEQPLEPYEMCTLTEIFQSRIESYAEMRLVMKHAYRYAKIVTIANEKIHDDRSREVMMRNRRIGLSLTGIAQYLGVHGKDELIHWLNSAYAQVERYDALYSQWYQVPRSIRMTTVKPSGTVSVLPCVTPGVHFSVAGRYFLRRVNMPAGSKLAMMLINQGYPVEDSAYTPNTWVIGFPVDMGPGVKSEAEVTPREQLELHAIMTRYWAGNNVSQTIKFDPKVTSPEDIAQLLAEYDSQTKAIAFLPLEEGVYKQMPYEALTEAEYNELLGRIKKVFSIVEPISGLHDKDDRYCDGDSCEIATFYSGGY